MLPLVMVKQEDCDTHPKITHHFAMVRVVGLADQREVFIANTVLNLNQPGKLKSNKNRLNQNTLQVHDMPVKVVLL